jgi:quaternary ammonium compound-resistance protein SugE
MNGWTNWLYLLIAAMFEATWTISLRLMKVDDLKSLRWDNFYRADVGLPILLPFIGYVVFGLANVYFFTLALKQIPMATAFAVWTASALILLKLIDVFYYKSQISFMELLFLALITIGIVGLKVYAAPAQP